MVDARERSHAQRLQAVGVDHHHPRGAVADLAGRGRAQQAALQDRLHARDPFERGVETDAFVDRVQVLVAVGQGDGDGNDFVLKRVGLGRRGRLAVTVERVQVQRVLGQAVLARHHFRAGELAELDIGIAFGDAGGGVVAPHSGLFGQGRGGEHRHAGHVLDAGRDHDILNAAHHRLGCEVQRLL